MPKLNDPLLHHDYSAQYRRSYREMGQYEKAIAYFNQALVIRQSIEDQNGAAVTHAEFARLERDHGGRLITGRHYWAALLGGVHIAR